MAQCLYISPRPDSAVLRVFAESGYRCHVAAPVDAAWEMTSQAWDVIVCDESAGRDSFAACAAGKRPDSMLLALLEADNKDLRISLLREGVDACLTRPFSVREVEALVTAFFRPRTAAARARERTPRPLSRSDDPDAACLSVSVKHRRATFLGRDLRLSAREYELLALLLRAAGQPLDRAAIWQSIWPADQEPNPALVDLSVARLRGKLRGCPIQVRRLRNTGYCADGRFRFL